jgi:hypothetical protein
MATDDLYAALKLADKNRIRDHEQSEITYNNAVSLAWRNWDKSQGGETR